MMHVERAAIAKSMQARQSSSAKAKLKPHPAWMGETEPRMSDKVADQAWHESNARLLGPSSRPFDWDKEE
jgi:hypothetical protein